MKVCPFCAEEIQDAAIVCKHCGRDLVAPPTSAAAASAPGLGLGYVGGILAQLPPHQHAQFMATYQLQAKDKTVAFLLTLFLGWLGAQRFYLGQVALGVLSLFFFWTLIPALISLIELLTIWATVDAHNERLALRITRAMNPALEGRRDPARPASTVEQSSPGPVVLSAPPTRQAFGAVLAVLALVVTFFFWLILFPRSTADESPAPRPPQEHSAHGAFDVCHKLATERIDRPDTTRLPEFGGAAVTSRGDGRYRVTSFVESTSIARRRQPFICDVDWFGGGGYKLLDLRFTRTRQP